MTIVYIGYNLLSTGLFILFWPLLAVAALMAGRRPGGLKQRLGLYPRRIAAGMTGSRRVWIHAASVGEVRVAAAIIEPLTAMIPGCDVIVSTMTATGHQIARELIGSRAVCIYAPLDLYFAVRRAFLRLRPDILVCLETEIWPNLLTVARHCGVKTALINGRISDRSIGRYLLIRPLIRSILAEVDAFSMIREIDARRILQIGARPKRVVVNGNAKFDLLWRQSDARVKARMAAMFNLGDGQPVFVAGSTRRPEENILLDAYEKIRRVSPRTVLILAPRHINRSARIASLVKKRRLACQLKTELDRTGARRTAPVVILDTMGELQAVYSIASVVFCGGSLARKGGQNVLEAAVWGKPVIYGPSMEDFRDAKSLLDRTGGGIQVEDGAGLEKVAGGLLADPARAAQIGGRARAAVLANRGAAHKHARVIRRLLAVKPDSR